MFYLLIETTLARYIIHLCKASLYDHYKVIKLFIISNIQTYFIQVNYKSH